MATIDSRAFIDRLIAGGGRIEQDDAPDNPRATKIVEYTNGWGKVAWGVVYPFDDQDRYEIETAYVRSPRVIWRRDATENASQ